MSISQGDWEAALRVLRMAADADAALPDRAELERLIQPIAKSARRRRRAAAAPDEAAEIRRLEQSQRDKTTARQRDAALRRGTEVQQLHLEGMHTTGTGGALSGPSQHCHICGAAYRELDARYHRLCPPCAAENRLRREQSADLSGRIALVTGGRIKIGYATALRLLRQGARVVVTTRFAHDAAHRFTQEPDFEDWRSRLEIHGLDFVDPRGVLGFAEALHASLPWLDILINNAAQTVKRPPSFYAAALAMSQAALPEGAKGLVCCSPPPTEQCSQLSVPVLRVDRHGQPKDERAENSWSLHLHEVPPAELLEVLLVNTAAPALLVAALKPLLLRSPHPQRFIINATGQDGRFDTPMKSARHPHVNMSKAALNMLTRTAASEFATSGIYMNSVDTGWVSDEAPAPQAESRVERGWSPPLDETDAAARLCAPVIDGLAGTPRWGLLFRHYHPSPW